jgi:hypothetical protein
MPSLSMMSLTLRLMFPNSFHAAAQSPLRIAEATRITARIVFNAPSTIVFT